MKVLYGLCRSIAALAFVLTVGAAVVQPAFAMDKVSVRLNWLPGAEHGFFFLAREKGWYKEAGLDVDIVAGQGSTLVVKSVGNGDNDFGVADVASVARGWEVGVPLVAAAIILKESPASVYSPATAGIKSLSDLCGKRLGLNIKSTTTAQYRAMLRQAKLSSDCKIDEVPTVAGGIKEIKAGLVDAAVTFGYEDPVMLEADGIPVNRIVASDFFKLYSLSIVTSENFLKSKPDVAARFMKVTLKALKYSIENPAEAVSAFTKIAPEANIAYENAKLKVFNSLIQVAQKDTSTVGTQDSAGWKDSLDILYKLEIVKKQMMPDSKYKDFSK